MSKMGRTSPRLPSFCLNRVITRVRVRSPPLESKPISSSIKTDRLTEFSESGEKVSDDWSKSGGRRIMIVIDPSQEAKGALQWALSHTVQNQDTIILLYVIKPTKQGDEHKREINPKGHDLPYSMKNMCHMRRPEVHVEVALVEGKEKGPTIVEEARKQGASLLVLGQKKRSMTWRLLMTWAGSRIGGSFVEYCIQNSDCMALAVRRKSKKGGGYLITTKRHKDFWLLA